MANRRGDNLDDSTRPSLSERLGKTFLKPTDSNPTPAAESRSVDELEAELRSATDKERAIGLIAAPFAAAIGILVMSALISNDPAAILKNGRPNRLHVPVSTYHEVLAVLIGLSVVMLGTAMWRKRLYLGISMALYGLAVFNLHYWGFGVPFILCAAWLLVRS